MQTDPEKEEILGTETILIVEDEPLIRSLVAQVLSDHGYKVTVVSNGSEALALSEEQILGIDILVTDIVMPVVNGVDVSNRLRTTNPNLKTLFISGYNAEIADLGRLRDGEAFLQKPFTQHELCATLRRFFR